MNNDFCQVLLMLASAMDSAVEAERVALEQLLAALVAELQLSEAEELPEMEPPVHCRTPRREMQLLIMRLLSESFILLIGLC